MTALLLPPPYAAKDAGARRSHAARLAVLVAALYGALPGYAQVQPPAPAPASAQKKAQTPAAGKTAEYVGSDVCQGCHEDIFNALEKSPHGLIGNTKRLKFEGKACESCHGPGSKHVESTSAADIVNPAKIKPAAADQVCMKCHLNQVTPVGRINSSHARNQTPCIACHSIHSGKLVTWKPAEVNTLCAGCHTDVWASFQLPYRHRVLEAAMSCVDCHNPHGTFLRSSIQVVRANEPGCFRCHGDLAGPFVFEHPPVRIEGCPSCHMPHGSNNPRMLVRSQVQNLCLECHSSLPLPTQGSTLGTVPPAFHDVRSPRFQNCTTCHQKIHGSYIDRGLLR